MSYFASVGLLRYGTVTGYLPESKELEITLDYDSTSTYSFKPINVPIPSLYSNKDGIYITSKIADGTTVVVGQIEGGEWVIVSIFDKSNDAITLDDNQLLIQSNSNNKIELDLNSINLTSKESYFKLNNNNNYTNNLQSYNFNESKRNISGIVKRDITPNSRYPNNLRLKGEDLDEDLKSICLDPTLSENFYNSKSLARNLPFVEDREVIYEFAHSSNYTNDDKEYKLYQDNSTISNEVFYNRRESRTDSLSLSIFSPNYLIEKIQGTVIDIFGNILDINRNIISIGKEKNISLKDADNKADAFKNIRELERKSIAYHFEINSRKDLTNSIDINSKKDYSKDRSKFFIDIDKEGQFKINIPASSEKGNIPLLTRYENYSTIKALENNDDVNKMLYNDESIDIYLDSFNKGIVNINDESNADGKAGPIDRIDSTEDVKSYIKHGTAHHDLTKVVEVFKNTDYFSYEYLTDPDNPFSELTTTKLNTIIQNDIVNKNLYISGDSSNVGGRSGLINFDGSIELNIGANSSDRQSMWLDCAGGILGAIGRDNNGISLALDLDGDLLIKVGGETIGEEQDSRFSSAKGYNNALRPGTIDFRVVNDSNEVTVFRIDRNGVTVLTPTRMVFAANQGMHFRCGGDMTFEAENLFLQNRLIQKGSDVTV